MKQSPPPRASDPFAREVLLEGLAGAGRAETFIIVVYAAEPILTKVKALSAFHRCKLDQVSHVESGRRYFQLRMGFFETLAQAEAALTNIRKFYQASFIERISAPAKGDLQPPGNADAARATPWFAVQLAASEQPINLEVMPRLDVFIAHRLYSVATQDARHLLRLGFFSDERSANMICDYLGSFFEAPSVVRVTVEEHGHFTSALCY